MESFAWYVEYHEFLDVFLQPFLSFSFGSSRNLKAVSKRGQEGASSDGSPMASPIKAKARPMNLVSHSSHAQLSAKNRLVQDLGNPDNPGNATTDMSSVSTRRWQQWRSTSKDPAEHSQAWKQENTQSTEAWEKDTRSKPSGSTGAWEQTRTVDSQDTKMEFRNMKIKNNQYMMMKVFQFLQKKLGIKTGYATFGMEATKTKIMMWGLFMCSSMKAAIHLVLNYTENLEAYMNTNFKQHQNLFEITKTLILEHSEENSEFEDDRKYITLLDEIDVVS